MLKKKRKKKAPKLEPLAKQVARLQAEALASTPASWEADGGGGAKRSIPSAPKEQEDDAEPLKLKKRKAKRKEEGAGSATEIAQRVNADTPDPAKDGVCALCDGLVLPPGTRFPRPAASRLGALKVWGHGWGRRQHLFCKQ